MSRESWVGAVALVLALAVGVALAASLVIIALNAKTDSTILIECLSTLAGTAVGAVAGYLGARAASGGQRRLGDDDARAEAHLERPELGG